MSVAPYEAIHAAIEQHWAAEWNSAAVPTGYAGAAPAVPNAAGEYVILSMQFGGASIMTIGRGQPTARETGMVFVQVIVPDGGGMRRAYEIAESAAAVWREAGGELLQLSAGSSRLQFDQPHVIQAGERDGYIQINIQAAFEFTTS